MSVEEIFAQIARGEGDADVVYETEKLVAFRDINPQAPVHVLVIPRRQIQTLEELTPEDGDLLGEMFTAAREVARREGIAQSGYRTVFNCGPDGGQEVYHLHLHVMGGRPMKWPPG